MKSRTSERSRQRTRRRGEFNRYARLCDLLYSQIPAADSTKVPPSFVEFVRKRLSALEAKYPQLKKE